MKGFSASIGPCSRRLHETCGLMVVAPVVVDIDGPAQFGHRPPIIQRRSERSGTGCPQTAYRKGPLRFSAVGDHRRLDQTSRSGRPPDSRSRTWIMERPCPVAWIPSPGTPQGPPWSRLGRTPRRSPRSSPARRTRLSPFARSAPPLRSNMYRFLRGLAISSTARIASHGAPVVDLWTGHRVDAATRLVENHRN